MGVHTIAKRFVTRMPPGVQERLKALWYSYQIHRGRFRSKASDWAQLGEWIRPGATVVDVGANVGYYTLKMAELAGPHGRVIALEPVPQTFRLLTRNTRKFQNVTLLNVAASDVSGTVNISIPMLNGWLHPSRAHIAELGSPVVALTVDGLGLSEVALAKIDAEGHEYEVLIGMHRLLERDKPVLVVEGEDERVKAMLTALGYSARMFRGSPNTVYTV